MKHDTVTIVRKAFICIHCEGVYADSPVTSCDCCDGTINDFHEGTIEYKKNIDHNGEKNET